MSFVRPDFRTVTISNGQTVSNVSLGAAETLIGIVTRSTFDGTSLTFQVSVDGTTFYPLCDPATGAAFAIVAAASKAYAIDPKWFLAWNFFTLVATAQTGDSILDLVVREIR